MRKKSIRKLSLQFDFLTEKKKLIGISLFFLFLGSGFSSKKFEDEVLPYDSSAPNGGLVSILIKTNRVNTTWLVQVEKDQYPCFEKVKKNESAEIQCLLPISYYESVGEKKGNLQALVDQKKVFEKEISYQVVKGKYKSEKIKVAPGKVSPSKKDLTRIRKESKEIRAIYDTPVLEKLWNGSYQMPIDSPKTSPFGTSRVFNGKLMSYHSGLDLKAAVGTPIHNALEGKVALAKNLFYTGGTVIVEHGVGIFTVYAHMSKIKVKQNQTVKTGDLLGLAGATGRVSGPHLHWGVTLHGVKVNPELAMEALKP